MRVGVVVVVGVAACATPYQAMGFRGGYSDSSVGNETYAVHVKVNGFTSAGTALEYAYRRAGDICPQGFDVLDGSRSAQYSAYVTSTGANVVTKPEVTMIVQCKTAAPVAQAPRPEPEEAPPPRAQPERRVVVGQNPMFCSTLSRDATLGGCYLDADECNGTKAALGDEYGPCEPHNAVSCFNANVVLDGKRTLVCAPSVAGCEGTLTSFRANPDFEVSPTMRCGVYRAQPSQAAAAP